MIHIKIKMFINNWANNILTCIFLSSLLFICNGTVKLPVLSSEHKKEVAKSHPDLLSMM